MKKCFLAIIALLFVNTLLFSQTTITPVDGIVYVKTVGASVAGERNGSSWANAAKLADVLEAAENPTSGIKEIRVAEGYYYMGADGPGDRGTFYIPPGITIAGGYPGENEDEISDPENRPTVLSGKNNADSPSGTATHVLAVINTQPGSITTIKGLVIQDGRAQGKGDLTIDGHTLNNNLGAGVYAYTEGTAQIIFEGNLIHSNKISIEENANELVEELDKETLIGEGGFEKKLTATITSVCTNLIKIGLGAIGCEGPCAMVVTKVPEKLIESGLELLFSTDAVSDFLENVYESQLELYALNPSLTVGGAGVYANGDIVFRNNKIYENNISAITHATLKNAKPTDLMAGAYVFMTTPLVYGAGAGLYAMGNITLDHNQITDNKLYAQSIAEIDPSLKIEGFFEKTMFISAPTVIAYGGGAYVSGVVNASNNNITSNRIDSRIENNRDFSIQGLKRSTTFSFGGQVLSFGGGAYFSGEVALRDNNFSDNEVNPSAQKTTGDLSFIHESTTSLAYGAGAVIEVNGELNSPIIIENSIFSDNSFSRHKWASANLLGNISDSDQDLEKVDGFIYAVNSGTGLAIENAFREGENGETLSPTLVHAQITGNKINNNKSKNTTDLKGGALYLNNINAVLNNNTISDNTVSVYNKPEYNMGNIKGAIGTGINLAIDFVPSYFRNKRAKSQIGANAEIKGGVIYSSNSLEGGSFLMNNCTISNNTFTNNTESQLWEAQARLEIDLFTSVYGGVYIKSPRVGLTNNTIGNNTLNLKSAIDERGHNFSYNKAMGAGLYIDHLDAIKEEADEYYQSTNESSIKGNVFSNNKVNATIAIEGAGLIFNPTDDSNIEVDIFGAGLYQDQGGITLANNQFLTNKIDLNASASGATHNGDNDVISKVYGGGAYLRNISGTKKFIQNNSFTGNSIDAEGNGDDWGTNSSDVVVRAYGGGLNMEVVKGKADFSGNSFTANEINVITHDDDTSKDTDANAFGGGLYLFTAKGTNVEMVNDIFLGNTLSTETYNDDAKAYARSYGGGFYGRLGGSVVTNRMEVRENSIKANSNEGSNDNEANALAYGAGIFLSRPDKGNGLFKSYNSLIAQNISIARVQGSSGATGGTHYANARGGAIYFDDVKADLLNLTIADNTLKTEPASDQELIGKKDVKVKKEGAGFYVEKSTVNAYNSIFYKNKAVDELATIKNENTKSISIVNSLYDENGMEYTDASSIRGNASFAGEGNYHQKKSSLGVDKGEDILPKQYADLDLDGKARVLDRIDLGAYEVSTQPDQYGIVYVKKGGTGDRSGRNWENACPEVAIALDEARQNGGLTKAVWVAEGTYMPMFKAAEICNDNTTPTTEHHKSLVLADNVEVYGGFPENANSTIHAPQDDSSAEKTRALAARDIKKYETILSGKLENGTAVYHVVIAPGTTGAILDGFTISGGEALTVSSTLEINIIIGENTYNIPDNSGGGIYCHSADYISRNLTVKNNAAHRGSGIYDYKTVGTAARIENCSFLDNETTDSGALDHNTGTLTVLNCEFRGNKTSQYGSAIYNRGTSTLNVVNTLVADNGRLSTSTADCSAVHNFQTASTLNIINSTIADNEGYGIYRRQSGTINVSNSIVWNNTKGSYFGEINVNYSLLEGGSTNNNCLNTDPLFVNTAEGDYSLRTISPAYNKGSNTLYSNANYGNLDIIGNARKNSTIDMGAYEFTGIKPDTNGVLYVKKGGSGSRTGNSWANAYPALAQVLYKIKQGENANIKEIWVAEGTYQPRIIDLEAETGGVDPKTHTFYLSPAVKVYGGFSKEANDRDNAPNEYMTKEQALSTRNWVRYETIMTGEYKPLIGDDHATVNVYHVVTGTGIPLTTTDSNHTILDGFTVSGGRATIAESSTTDKYGAGIYLNEASVELNNLIIKDNEASYDGGGIYFYGGKGTDKGRILILNNVLVENNTTGGLGAGIYANGGLLRISYSKFINNQASLNGGVGEGIYYKETDSEYKKRNAYSYWDNSWFSSDESSFYVDIINTLIAKNTRGIYLNIADEGITNFVRILNTTITDNEKGGVDFETTNLENKIKLLNSIVWNNGEDANDIFKKTMHPNDFIANILPEYAPEDLVGTNTKEDPKFADAANGDYSLATGSPAIDKGSNSQYNNAVSTAKKDFDLAGGERFYGTIDKGAYESQPPVDPDDNGIVYVWEGKTGAGTSWDDAYPNLHTPLKRARTDKRIKHIWVAYGNYTLDTDNKPMELVQGVKVYGGFKGTEESIDERILPIAGKDITENISYTDKNSSLLRGSTDPSSYIFTAKNLYYNPLDENANTVLDGFAFTTDTRSIQNTAAAYTIRNAYFVGNNAHFIINNIEGSDVVLENALFKNNSIVFAPIENTQSSLSINNSLLRGTKATILGDGSVQVILNSGTYAGPASLFVQNTLIVENEVNGKAVIYNSGVPDFTLINTTIANNLLTHAPIGNSGSGGVGKIYNTIISCDDGIDASWIKDGWNIQHSNLTGLVLTGSHKDKGNQNADPMFNADYSLDRRSYLVNAGENDLFVGEPYFETDIVGNTRVIDNTIDMGALENTLAFDPDPAGIVYVWEGKTGSGTSWDDAYPNLADALHKARTDSRIKQIWVAKGTYKPEYRACDTYRAADGDEDLSFVLRGGLKLYGGFAGYESAIDERIFDGKNSSVLDGNLENDAHVYHLLIAAGLNASVTVDGFAVTGAAATNSSSEEYPINGVLVDRNKGAGIFIKEVRNIELKHIDFYNNEATDKGANIYVESSILDIHNSRVGKSESAVEGAGLYSLESDVTIVNSLFHDFHLDKLSSGSYVAEVEGCAIYFYNKVSGISRSLNVINSTITNCIPRNESIEAGLWPPLYIDANQGTTVKIYNSIVDAHIGTSAEYSTDITITLKNTASKSGGQKWGAATIIQDVDNNFIDRFESKTTDLHYPGLKDKGNNAIYNEFGSLTEDRDLDDNLRLDNETIDLGPFEEQNQIKPDVNGIVYVWEGKTGAGTSWDDAYPNLADPLLAAKTNKRIKQIWVAEGNYIPLHMALDDKTITEDKCKSFVLVEGVNVYGGFAGTEESIDERVPGQNESVLNGKLSDDVGVYHVVIASNIKETNTVLDGFSITGSKQENQTSQKEVVNGKEILISRGAAIYGVDASLAINDVAMYDNKMSSAGSVIHSDNSEILLTNSIIRNNVMNNYNTAERGIIELVSNSNIEAANVLIAENKASFIIQAWENSSVYLTNLTIANNTTSSNAAFTEIFDITASSTCELYNTIVYGNTKDVLGSAVTQSHCLVGVDPVFMTGTYMPGQTSPAVDMGKNDYYNEDNYGSFDIKGNPRFNSAKIDIGAYESLFTPVLVWNGLAADNDWNNDANWTPNAVPTQYTTVYIPGNVTSYPQLNKEVQNKCGEIYFMHGAELGRPDLLSYNQAYIQLNLGLKSEPQQKSNDYEEHLAFSAEYSAPALARDRWYMLSSPLQEIVTGDLGFGGYPNTFLRKFSVEANDDNPFTVGSWSNYFRTNAEPIAAGEGFVYHVRGYKDAPYYLERGDESSQMSPDGGVNFGLAEVNGIVELPFFENETISQAHRLHEYNPKTQTSTFGRIKSDGTSLPMTATKDLVTRDTYKAYHLANQVVKTAVNFADDFALIGNPYMSSINFDRLVDENADIIKGSYYVWTGEGFSSYDVDGNTSGVVTVSEIIPPMQSILVEKASNAAINSSVTLDISKISTTGSPGLRSMTAAGENKIELTATNTAGSVLTFIAHHEGGSLAYGNKDTRKILMGISNMPEVYSLKESDKGSVAVGGNYLDTNDALVPIGLATTLAGNITFTLEGMDLYNASITFIDTETKTEVDITGEESYEYAFDYTPQVKGKETLSTNNRFFLRFSPFQAMDLDEPGNESVYVYQEHGEVSAVASANNLIRECYIYNTQGVLLYSNPQVDSPSHKVKLLAAQSEVVIVRLVTQTGIKNVKLLIK